MNIWENTVITAKGLALLAKMTAGRALTITKAETGSGYVTPGLLQQQTAVTDPKQTLVFRNASYTEDGKCKLPCYLTNDGVPAGYTASQVGIYAEDPDEGEILYFIAQATSGNGTVVPSETEMPGYSAEWTFYFQYGQADGVNVTVDPSNAVTREELDSKADKDFSNVDDETVKNKVKATEWNFLVGNGSNPMVEKTPLDVRFKLDVDYIQANTVPNTSIIRLYKTSGITNTSFLNAGGLFKKSIKLYITGYGDDSRRVIENPVIQIGGTSYPIYKRITNAINGESENSSSKFNRVNQIIVGGFYEFVYMSMRNDESNTVTNILVLVNDNNETEYVAYTLQASKWVGDTAPYTYIIEGYDDKEVNVYEDGALANIEQLEALASANIKGSPTSAENILYAFGEKPTIDLPVALGVR